MPRMPKRIRPRSSTQGRQEATRDRKARHSNDREIGVNKDEMIEKLAGLMEQTAYMLRGMTMDPAIPKHAKDAMHLRIKELEDAVEEAIE